MEEVELHKLEKLFVMKRFLLASRSVSLHTRKKFVKFHMEHMHIWLGNLNPEKLEGSYLEMW